MAKTSNNIASGTMRGFETHFSTVVLYILIAVGLLAEFLGLYGIVKIGFSNHENMMIGHIQNDMKNWKDTIPLQSEINGIRTEYSIHKFVANICIAFMLIHQFFIFRNFHIIDHLDKVHKKKFGDWVTNCIAEDILRILLFILFAYLTGEGVYLILILKETFGSLNFCCANLTWIKIWYIRVAITMAGIMFFWNLFGMKKDKFKLFSKSAFKLKKIKNSQNDIVVTYPFQSTYTTFFFSDSLGLIFWILIYEILFSQIVDLMFLMFFVDIIFIIYIVLIFARLIGELKVNLPKVKNNIVDYWNSTSFW